MPGTACVRRSGVTYCLDIGTGVLEVFDRTRVSVRDCPVDIIGELLAEASKKLTADEIAPLLMLIAQQLLKPKGA
jgi:hypothetical protein